jgi:hypothetical protein
VLFACSLIFTLVSEENNDTDENQNTETEEPSLSFQMNDKEIENIARELASIFNVASKCCI